MLDIKKAGSWVLYLIVRWGKSCNAVPEETLKCTGGVKWYRIPFKVRESSRRKIEKIQDITMTLIRVLAY